MQAPCAEVVHGITVAELILLWWRWGRLLAAAALEPVVELRVPTNTIITLTHRTPSYEVI